MSMPIRDSDLSRMIINENNSKWKEFFNWLRKDVTMYNDPSLSDEYIKNNFLFKKIDDLLKYYDDIIYTFDDYIGLELNPKEEYNKNVLSKFVVKACVEGGYYYSMNTFVTSGAEINGDYSLASSFAKTWGILHEIGHGYEGHWYGKYVGHTTEPVKDVGHINLSECANNIFAFLYERKFIENNKIQNSWLLTSGYARENNIKKWNLDDLEKALNTAYSNGKNKNAKYFDEYIYSNCGNEKIDGYHLKLYFITSKVFNFIESKNGKIIINPDYKVLQTIYRNYRKELNCTGSKSYKPSDRLVRAIYYTTKDSSKTEQVKALLTKYKIYISDDVLAEDYTLGDINQDGKVNIQDVLKLRRYISYTSNQKIKSKHPDWDLTQEQKKAANVNNDTEINIQDVLKLRRYIASNENVKIKQRHPNWTQI